MQFTIGTHSDDLVDLNGEESDQPPGSAVIFTLPSGEVVKAMVDYRDGWEIGLTLPKGTTHVLDIPSYEDDE